MPSCPRPHDPSPAPVSLPPQAKLVRLLNEARIDFDIEKRNEMDLAVRDAVVQKVLQPDTLACLLGCIQPVMPIQPVTYPAG